MSNKNIHPNTPTARLMLDAFRVFENELASQLESEGFTDVTSGNFNILRHLNPEGMHLSELARDAKISKQAIGKMVKDLEYKNYVELIPDNSDARAKHVRLTGRGQALIKLAIARVAEMEKSYQSLLGAKNYNTLRQSIIKISQFHQKSLS